ncbi:hypothetical protein DDZ14_15355 [Maritimibacter sp. 55A14]|uniref:hypothetical protein n=1 Tax=Maritimibacter sp. 55A14 TaxID=2174844 RepID=UPI000D61EAC6|nr:hypothetical protein [Maritimibacter sp. 55A14]PWE30530.1 hypothetical protein DDZ14_15355 [Maritimibacter sp. 55A14]
MSARLAPVPLLTALGAGSGVTVLLARIAGAGGYLHLGTIQRPLVIGVVRAGLRLVQPLPKEALAAPVAVGKDGADRQGV